MDFSALKKRGSNLKELAAKIEKSAGNNFADERIFKPGFDAKGSPAGYAVIRFIPNKFGETFVKAITYQFNGKGGFYSEVSPKTEDNKSEDPVAMVKGALWNMGTETGDESYKTKAKKFQRSEVFYANVYVEKDQVNPANNGKIMIYRFGYSIFKLLEQAVKPEFEDDVAFDPFDLWNGRPLKIKIVAKEMPDSRTGKPITVPNYENSEFGDICEFMAGDDAKKEELYGQTYDLAEFLKFKPFPDLVKRFREVYGEDYTTIVNSSPQQQAVDAAARLQEQYAQHAQNASVNHNPDASASASASGDSEPPFDSSAAAPAVVQQPQQQMSSDTDDALARFRRLASQ